MGWYQNVKEHKERTQLRPSQVPIALRRGVRGETGVEIGVSNVLDFLSFHFGAAKIQIISEPPKKNLSFFIKTCLSQKKLWTVNYELRFFCTFAPAINKNCHV